MCRSVFSYAEGVVCIDELDGKFHECRHAYCRFHIIGENKECGTRTEYSAMKRDTVDDACHGKLCNSSLKETAGEILFAENSGLLHLEDLPGDNRREEAKKTARGGYVVVDAENPEVVLVGNGSDVALLVHAAEELKNEGVAARVVSVPSIGLFNSQSEEYRRSVIPAGVRLFGLTSGLPATLYPLLNGGEYRFMGMERFGASAPAKVLDEKFGYNTENVLKNIKLFLKK